jgi:hypothetical protein
VRLVFVQPFLQRYRCRGCDGDWCRPGPRAPAADTEVRCGPGCVFGAVVLDCTGTRGDGMCMRWRCCVCGSCSCSLCYNRIGAAGAVAICAGLVHLPQLQTLEYVVCPAVCLGPWFLIAWGRGSMARVCAGGVVCAACVCAALAITVSVTQERRPLVQGWSTCPSCRHWSTLCARLCVWCRGVCLHGNAGRLHVYALEVLCVRLVLVQPLQQQYR